MIFTCTFMPTVDYTAYLSNFERGELNRTNEVYYYPGGKGINVSRVVHRLGAETVACGFIGGFTGDYIEDFLQKEGIKTDFIRTTDITRINVKIKSTEETELNGPGPILNEKNFQRLLERISRLTEDDWLVIAGRIPASLPSSFVSELATLCEKNKVRLVVDTSGPALKQIMEITKPFLIKPNEQELGELVGKTIHSKQEAVGYAKKLVGEGIQHVVISMGKEGALYVSATETLAATAPKGKLVNSVGAGDSLVSGFIASYSIDGHAENAFRYGVASGSATAFQSDLCKKEDVESLLSQVIITKL
ncbi:1-phosphofructokinase [Sporosarcina ureae]|uniref:Tagatose-6-phosphate kinase n=1 Tax=Sporosarcina ureae TaxID=1571 RepID=A0ABM6JT26_SPOUR|nr:1-phosphofructokinase [Sporosarcina ureae]ARF13357.1 1-phosphofructokinase [Sporosarcina ureae]